MFLLSIRRRKKEIRYVSVVTFVAVFFLTGIMLLQDILNGYVLEQSRQNYGGWTISSIDEALSHPYFAKEGKCVTLTKVSADKNLTSIPAYVGTVDENLWKMGNLRLYEGRMPERTNEIVMDMPTLSVMGYSYDIGQEVTLYWEIEVERDGVIEKVVMERTYQLVGVLHSFASAWQSVESKELPGILIMEEEAKYYSELHTTWYYSLKNQYQSVNALEFYEGIQANCKKAEHVMYNSYVHTEQLWGSGNAFRYVEYVMILIAVSAMGFLLASYTAKRRKVYYQYRCMGASLWQVRKMILLECFYATIPAIMLGMVLAYGIACIGCAMVASVQGMSNFFAFRADIFARQIAAIAIVLMASIGWTILQIRDKGLVQGKQEVTIKQFQRLRKRALKTKHPQNDFLNRYNRLHPFSRAIFLLFCVLVMGVIVLCGNKLNHNLTYRYAQYQEMIDFTLSVEDGFKLDTFTDGKNPYGPYGESYVRGKKYRFKEGLFEDDVTELENIWGVYLKKQMLRDDLLFLEWEEKRESAFIQYVNENNRNYGNELDYGFHVRFFGNREELAQEIPYFVSDLQVDWDAWENGEEIILVWCNFAGVEDQTVQPGEQMEIGWVDLPKCIPITVGAVYSETQDRLGQIFEDGYRYTMTNIIASKQLALRLADMYAEFSESELVLSGIGTFYKGKVTETNLVWGQFDKTSSFESTDKQLSRMARQNGWDLRTDAEERRMFYQNIQQEVGVFGSLFFLILAVFLILQKNLADSQSHYRKEQYRLLKKIGMDEKNYLRRTMVSAAKDYVWIFGGIVVGYLLYGMFVLREYAENFALDGVGEMYCKWTETWTSDAKLLALDHVIYQMEHIWTIVIVAAIFVILMSNRLIQTRQYMKKEEM